jgi:hypothetical protein
MTLWWDLILGSLSANSCSSACCFYLLSPRQSANLQEARNKQRRHRVLYDCLCLGALKMEQCFSSKRHVPEDGHLHSHHREIFKYDLFIWKIDRLPFKRPNSVLRLKCRRLTYEAQFLFIGPNNPLLLVFGLLTKVVLGDVNILCFPITSFVYYNFTTFTSTKCRLSRNPMTQCKSIEHCFYVVLADYLALPGYLFISVFYQTNTHTLFYILYIYKILFYICIAMCIKFGWNRSRRSSVMLEHTYPQTHTHPFLYM